MNGSENMRVEIERVQRVTLEGREVNELWRLLKNECQGAVIADSTTYDMYLRLKRWFEEEE